MWLRPLNGESITRTLSPPRLRQNSATTTGSASVNRVILLQLARRAVRGVGCGDDHSDAQKALMGVVVHTMKPQRADRPPTVRDCLITSAGLIAANRVHIGALRLSLYADRRCIEGFRATIAALQRLLTELDGPLLFSR